MIEVRVRENHGIDILGRDGCILPVTLAPFLLALKQAAINQNLETISATQVRTGINEVLGAGDHPRRSQELDVGQADLHFTMQFLDCRNQIADGILDRRIEI